jgi:hypothetical protein
MSSARNELRLYRLLLPAFAGLALTACTVTPPSSTPGEEAVYRAAESVIKDRYALWGTFRNSSSFMALSPVEMDGGYKSRKQISVLVRRTYIGGYEPIVRVTKLIETGSPTMSNNVEAPALAWRVTEAVPFAVNEWEPIDYLPYEEQEIYDEILRRMRAQPAPAPQTPPPAAEGQPASGG